MLENDRVLMAIGLLSMNALNITKSYKLVA